MEEREARRRWKLQHPDYWKRWALQHPDYWKKYKAQHHSWWLAYRKQWRDKRKLEAFQHYSGPIPSCQCCGENHIQFLVIDHINGGGNNQRKQRGAGGKTIYIWLKQQNYPNGFRVLCANCNMAKAFYRRCPHETEPEPKKEEGA